MAAAHRGALEGWRAWVAHKHDTDHRTCRVRPRPAVQEQARIFLLLYILHFFIVLLFEYYIAVLFFNYPEGSRFISPEGLMCTIVLGRVVCTVLHRTC